MGQISVEIYASPGSLLSANQQDTRGQLNPDFRHRLHRLTPGSQGRRQSWNSQSRLGTPDFGEHRHDRREQRFGPSRPISAPCGPRHHGHVLICAEK